MATLGGVRVKAYLYENQADLEMERIYPIITALCDKLSPHDDVWPASREWV